MKYENTVEVGSSYKSVEGSGVLINHISDHLPCFTYLKFKNSTNRNHKYVYTSVTLMNSP